MRSKIIIFIGLLLLSGCAEIDRAATAIKTYGAKGADRTFDAAWWSYCKTPTGGALFRKYENDPDGLVLWGKTCWRDKTKLHEALEEITKPPAPSTPP